MINKNCETRAPRFVPNNQLIVDLGCEVNDDGWVTTDATGRTSVAGVGAAGNVVDPRAQVITAAGAGSAAAIALNADLTADDVLHAVHAVHALHAVHAVHQGYTP